MKRKEKDEKEKNVVEVESLALQTLQGEWGIELSDLHLVGAGFLRVAVLATNATVGVSLQQFCNKSLQLHNVTLKATIIKPDRTWHMCTSLCALL